MDGQHLHPNNQRLLCSLLSSISIDRGVQVLITTHSRHVLDAMYGDAKLLWVQNGEVNTTGADDQVEILLELGALDIKEKVQSKKFKIIVLTEDRVTNYLTIILSNSGFNMEETVVLPYNGVTSLHLLKPLIKQIKDLSQAAIIVHKDRVYLADDEAELWKKDIRAVGAEPFVTGYLDMEGYFCTEEYMKVALSGENSVDLIEVKNAVIKDETGSIITSYVNGRVDLERKNGTIGKLDFGKLSAAAAAVVQSDPFKFMKGKQKLAKLRKVLQVDYGIRFEINKNAALPLDQDLAIIAQKHFGKK